MKFHSVASADIQNGKGQEAWDLVIKSVEYANKSNPWGTQTEVLQNVAGRGNRVIWVARHDSLSDADEFRVWLQTDEGHQEILAGSEEFMDWSTFDRQYFRVRNIQHND